MWGRKSKGELRAQGPVASPGAPAPGSGDGSLGQTFGAVDATGAGRSSGGSPATAGDPQGVPRGPGGSRVSPGWVRRWAWPVIGVAVAVAMGLWVWMLVRPVVLGDPAGAPGPAGAVDPQVVAQTEAEAARVGEAFAGFAATTARTRPPGEPATPVWPAASALRFDSDEVRARVTGRDGSPKVRRVVVVGAQYVLASYRPVTKNDPVGRTLAGSVGARARVTGAVVCVERRDPATARTVAAARYDTRSGSITQSASGLAADTMCY